MNFTAEKVKKDVLRQLDTICGILAKGKDVELRKTTGDTVKVVEVSKKVR